MAKKQKYYIYMHKNKINNKVYIGQTCSIRTRWYPNCYKSSSYFYSAIQKYGWDNFEHKILEEVLTLEEADKLEQYWIKHFDSTNRDKGYNLLSGGKNGYSHTKDTINKIKEGNKNYWKTQSKEEAHLKAEKAYSAARKPVICLNNNKIFNSLTAAAEYAGLKHSTPICRCCKGERVTAGKHPTTQERLRWSYYNKEKKEKDNG